MNQQQQTQRNQQQRQATKESLQLTLDANRELQTQIQLQLQDIYQRQGRNRQAAANCVEYLEKCIHQNSSSSTTTRGNNNSNNNSNLEKNKNEQHTDEDDIPSGVPKPKLVNALFQSTSSSISHPNATTTTTTTTTLQPNPEEEAKGKEIQETATTTTAITTTKSTTTTTPKLWYKKRKQFIYDPRRRWNFEYFIDPLGSRPSENDDLVRRKRTRRSSDDHDHDDDGFFFHHTSPPWSKHELGHLKRIISEDPNNNNTTNQTRDWNQVANELRQVANNNNNNNNTQPSSSSLKKFALPTTARARTPKECELAHRRSTTTTTLVANKKPKKHVMVHVLERVHQATSDGRPIDWKAMAEELSKGGGAAAAADRNDVTTTTTTIIKLTPWQLFTKYQQDWKTPQDREATAWKASIEQDELLVRYLALQGPQFIWDKSEAAHLGRRLFSKHTLPKQLIHRSKSHCVNPNLSGVVSDHNSSWNLRDERKLVLCMKVYQHYPEPAIMAATHFYPHRTARQVSHKWDRSLCPQRNSQVAFSKQEDELLCYLAKAREGGLNFGEMARQEALFVERCRGPHQLYQRWRDIASPEDLATRTVQEQWKTTAVSPQDFVLQVKAKNQPNDSSASRKGGLN
jgi:hypothetical protein